MKMNFSLFLSFLGAFFSVVIPSITGAYNDDSDRVYLKNIQTLTLYSDRRTTGRRSSPVPQLNCIGGTAGCQNTPKVVQCTNRGSDGNDIQWECKADLDNAYRFGSVEVSCEGYDYPNDEFILKGSCGLEYTLDLTEEGYQRHKQQGQKYQHHQSSYVGTGFGKSNTFTFGHLLFFGGIIVAIYMVYKTCFASNTRDSNTDRPRHNQWGGSQPPPYGFRPEFMPGQDSFSSSSSYTGTSTNTNADGGGFWTGAATGGLLGYMFGRNSGYNTYTQHEPYSQWGYSRPRSYFSGWGNAGTTYRGSASSSSDFFSAPASSGTRTASGFGGTKRR